MASGPLAVAVFKQFVQVSPSAKVQAKGDVVVAEMTCPPLPARSPPRVVEPVPPLAAVRAVLKVTAPDTERDEEAERGPEMLKFELIDEEADEMNPPPNFHKLFASSVVVRAPEVLYMSIMLASCPDFGAIARVVVAMSSELMESFAYGVEDAIPTRFVEVETLINPPSVFIKVQFTSDPAPDDTDAHVRFPDPSVFKKFPFSIVSGHV
ncbi:MAG: hypothetical protein UX43_C0014G0015 [Candidatus Giovannonibacteria bacterium GW2011_GWB1_46_20]|uniref:Uncharacterized protein n=1 Tax=Candidatus Giovannonibacteria bacterium GW2011_GWA1_44_25 TaxID=1618645 RepID=A0A0G1KRR7_9BACT|nr:MAG: hypothetical protein UW53_C0024G0015 [Candidatus Giovannonibacteria bacterium GW2011_GWA1_44_25]KKU29240.1 MAG: hypothetical protein UX43_C0014G0015 [Candidatus Giovannonibacteria bacterium GW2011_GWB1_46_20]